ncbi:MAG: helix-turn-helix transcriptional regulator [Clostridia bacterium]|nr:helix-turn-helix transcriptional regulator [Clostridia bacterium]
MNDKLKTRRTELKLSQAELARRVGVSRQTVNMIESGSYNPTLELCIRIAKELGVTLNDLFWKE